MTSEELLREIALEANYGDHMANMARYWVKRAQEAERTCAILILAAGGEIRVRLSHKLHDLTVERLEDVEKSETVFRSIARGGK